MLYNFGDRKIKNKFNKFSFLAKINLGIGAVIVVLSTLASCHSFPALQRSSDPADGTSAKERAAMRGLRVTAFRGHNVAVQSEEWKQNKIETLYQNYLEEFPLVKTINVRQLQQWQHQGREIVLVDVRSPEEVAVSMIPGAITQQEFETNIENYKNSKIIAYCTIGYRSGKYAESWQERGVEILNLEGSLLAWSHIRGKLVNSKGRTNQVHVFNRRWRLVADNYQPIW